MSRRLVFSILSLLVIVHAGLLAWSAAHQSVNFDEAAHLAAGAAYWHDGEMGIYAHSPPLLRYWGALPAVLIGVKVPNTAEYAEQSEFVRHWEFSRAFAQLNRDHYQKLVLAGRLGTISLSCAGLLIVYIWARALWGAGAGLGAAAVWAFEPNILAHGSIIGTDIGTAVFCAAAAWCWWRYLERPTTERGIVAALVLAGALLCKFTVILLLPALYALRVVADFYGGRGSGRRIGRMLLLMAAVIWLTIAGAYQFRHIGFRIGPMDFYSKPMLTFRRALPSGFWVPLPRDMVEGFDAQEAESEAKGYSFLFGHAYKGARSLVYYPVAVAAKFTPELLVLIGAAGAVALVRWVRRHERPNLKYLAVVLPGAALASIVLLSEINIGVRYLLPALPFVIIGVGGLLGLMFTHRVTRWFAAALLMAMAGEAIAQAPRFMTYASPLTGGPGKSWQVVMADFDWGQGVRDLARWQLESGSGRIGIAIQASIDPGIYGLNATPCDRLTDEKFVAVSTFFLEGLGRPVPLPGGGMTELPVFVGQWRALWDVPPVFIADDCIYVFRRADFDAAALAHNSVIVGSR